MLYSYNGAKKKYPYGMDKKREPVVLKYDRLFD
jgi:hypothetical protein